jgi:O-antigen/teichoic acid export membrane protein
MASILVPGLYAVGLVAYLLRSLGPEAYAPWAAAVSMLGWLALLDVGLSTVTIRAAARVLAGDLAAQAQLRATNAAYALLAPIAVGLGILVSALIPGLLELRGQTALDAWLVGSLLALDLGIVVFTAGWVGTLRGGRRYDVLLVLNVVQVATSGLLAILLIPALGLVGAAAAQPIGRLIARAAMGLWLRRSMPWLSLRPGRPGPGALRGVAAASWPVMASQVAVQVGQGLDIVIVGLVASSTTVGLYAVGSQLIRYLSLFLLPSLGVLFPAFSVAAFRQPEEIQRLLARALAIGALVGCCVFGSIALEATDVLNAWSAQDSELSVQVLDALAYVVLTPNHVIRMMVVARDRHAATGALVLVASVANLALSLVLAFTVGPVGPAISTFLVFFLAEAAFVPVLAARLLGIPVLALARPMVGGFLVGLAIILPLQLLPLAGVEGLLVRGAITAAGVTLAAWVLLRETAERGRPASAAA